MNDRGAGEAQSTGKSSGPRRKSRSERTNPMLPPHSTNDGANAPEEPPPQADMSWRRRLRRLSWLRRVPWSQLIELITTVVKLVGALLRLLVTSD